ncbi:MAG: GNAT family N-acetyltransferase [Firmicutes bacterium HGW-Firmicutes-7]|nr:MAG: GNAT family N-acetyltransferase [Firmicutes bacterium HGW-Firmicutes-7]
MLEGVIIKEIEFSSEQYKTALEIRNQVLRKPHGLSIYEENLTTDAKSIHISAYYDNEMIGTLVMTEINEEKIKMRQVAVEPKYREQNVGKQLVLYAEDFARAIGYKKIVLHAREESVGFYERLGYTKLGSSFIEVTIPHYKMEKALT